MKSLTVFGLPAVEIAGPRGAPVVYLIRPVRPVFGESTAWELTKPDGDKYRVGLSGDSYTCSCQSFKFRRECKHGVKVVEYAAPFVPVAVAGFERSA